MPFERFFGKSKPKAPAPTTADVIARAETRGDSVQKKIDKLDIDIKKENDKMKRMRPGRARDMTKSKLLKLLKQKRMYQGHQDSIQAQIINMDQQAFAIDSVKDTQEMVGVIKANVSALRKGMKQINIDQVDDMQDTMADLLDESQEMQDILSREYGGMEDIDDADLEAELDALDDYDFDMEAGILDLPSASTTAVPTVPAAGVPAAPVGVPAGPTPVDEFGLADLGP